MFVQEVKLIFIEPRLDYYFLRPLSAARLSAGRPGLLTISRTINYTPVRWAQS